jgi:hypothetical protein
MNGYEESHVVMQEWKFDLDEKDDVSSNKHKQRWLGKQNNHEFL